MRIIAGSRARSNILAPRDMTTRPITDRVKESLFSILKDQDRLVGARVADLFCGTGSMGLEALSRGAKHAVFADMDRDAISRLHKNLAKLFFEQQATMRCVDIFRYGIPALPVPADGAENAGLCNLIFVDPPYRLSVETDQESKLGKLLLKLSEQVADGALLVVRQQKRSQPVSQTYGTLNLSQRRQYGGMILSFLESSA